MQFYLVGGAVRDQLLGLPVKERDWVVVGATPEQLDCLGYRPVGDDFPVFLHPKTKEEYALARTERKSGHGYHGFSFYAAPQVTLDQDLIRRDLTINAIAQDSTGAIIDPYGGQQDLASRTLRHVSKAFAEDPVRILRLARFYARFAHLGFTVAETTKDLVRKMVLQGEAKHLVAERVWAETQKALMTQNPQLYFYLLHECGALEVIFPEIAALFGVPQPMRYHPEIDAAVHTLLVLYQAAQLSSSIGVRFAALCHDLGKAKTPAKKWPSHRGHEQAGVPVTQSLCQRLKIAKKISQEAILATRWHTHIHRIHLLQPQQIDALFSAFGAYKDDAKLKRFLQVCEADVRGRLGFEKRNYPQPLWALKALEACSEIQAQSFIKQGLKGPEIGQALSQARITAISHALKTTRLAKPI